MEVLRDQNWLLSVGTFLPLAGVLVMLFIPKAEEELHKLVALLTAGATLAVGIYTLTQFDSSQAGTSRRPSETMACRAALKSGRAAGSTSNSPARVPSGVAANSG